MMRRYSPDQIELLMAVAGVLVFAGLWFPFVVHVVKVRGSWLEVPAAALPLLLLAGVLAFYWRRFRE